MKPMLAVQAELEKLKFPVLASPKLDGCFTACTRIWTDRGLVKIGDLVDQKMQVKVASFNETSGEIEFKPVVGWFDNGLKPASEWMSYGAKARVTKSHKVYTLKGWVAAAEADDEGLRIDPNLGAAITGMLLGDAVAVIEKRYRTERHSWRLSWSTSDADSSYGYAKARLLQNWVTYRTTPYVSGFGHPQIGFVTSTCSSLPYDLSRFYVLDRESESYGRRKADLDLCDIMEDFNDLSLAIWYFDDGTVQYNNGNASTPRIHFSVARYSDTTLENIKRLFQVKYGFTPTIEKYGRDIKMSFTSAESTYLLWRISIVAGQMMPRKMLQGLDLSSTEISGSPTWLPTLVGKPMTDDSTKAWRAYDIEVADNHNYFADGQLVHNCRAIIQSGVVLSRSLKPIPNQHVQRLFGTRKLDGLDGELIVGAPNDPCVYRNTNSGVMSQRGEPEVRFFVFDYFLAPTLPYTERYKLIKEVAHVKVEVLQQHLVMDHEALLKLEEKYLNEGYEGLMLRDPKGTYKFGRSTVKEGILLKLKRFTDAEARIVGFEELMKNGNEAKTNALGYTERSSHKDNLIPMNTLGALIVQDMETGVEFNIGSGFTQSDREEIWTNRTGLVGQIVKYKSFDVGVKDKPRFPIFLGLRDDRDL